MKLHPMMVHFPIALLLVGVGFDIAGLRTGREDLRKAGLYMMGIGLVGGLLALVTGGMAEEQAEELFPRAEEMVHRHSFLALTTMALFGTLFVWRWRGSQAGRAALPYITLAAVATLALLATGHTGGEMVYDQPRDAAYHIDRERGERGRFGGFGEFGESGERRAGEAGEDGERR